MPTRMPTDPPNPCTSPACAPRPIPSRAATTCMWSARASPSLITTVALRARLWHDSSRAVVAVPVFWIALWRGGCMGRRTTVVTGRARPARRREPPSQEQTACCSAGGPAPQQRRSESGGKHVCVFGMTVCLKWSMYLAMFSTREEYTAQCPSGYSQTTTGVLERSFVAIAVAVIAGVFSTVCHSVITSVGRQRSNLIAIYRYVHAYGNARHQPSRRCISARL
jgi:hypothetical protein